MKKALIWIILLVLLLPSIFILYFISSNNFITDSGAINQENAEKITDIKLKKEDYNIIIQEFLNNQQDKGKEEIDLSKFEVFPYQIVWKDTLADIAYKFSLDKEEIAALVYLNNIENINMIIAGKILLIPRKK
ncbi:MAG: LysM peptidoglycan-binding domain-containing protein [Spirochaetes bacterium]|jgi:hypothetical protein|nr:LysM peptidoglycan-binding domain-containing protein [Spirochaetota bacterium]NLJ05911.1 LysM peptidoglycan-binding domain-containing protein [Exilispira sp.]MBP8991092.1 LysM peptidoglycan-binding domain-containing protein [Spirochaetota bacterium]HNV43474.1 LysM peptidoglycan-binding domain-containing protein [Exilispira sp.]HOV45941.1 LysM peptidoglycan-binding domain-containing protein [Exilispira sp.]